MGELEMPGANRKYKDTVFRDLFGSAERRAEALSLYNALAGTSYDDPSELDFAMLDQAIYMSVRNDVAYVVGDELALVEHQSTVNPNMPLRGLLYFAGLYSALVKRSGASPYSRSRIALPAPRYVVVYAGAERRPARETLRLSDSFVGTGSSLEVACEVVNVNPGLNPELEEACPALRGYGMFVEGVRRYNGDEGMALGDAVDASIDDCIAAGQLVDYFSVKRAEVRLMFIYEYSAEELLALERADGYREGEAAGRKAGLTEGEAAGRLETLASLVADGVLTAADAAARMGVGVPEFEEMAAAGYSPDRASGTNILESPGMRSNPCRA